MLIVSEMLLYPSFLTTKTVYVQDAVKVQNSAGGSEYFRRGLNRHSSKAAVSECTQPEIKSQP